MEYFVTGATGLIGTHVVRALVGDGHDVVALTRSRSNATHLPDEVTVVEGDITTKGTIQEAMAGVDGVFHIAAWVYVGPGPRKRETAERINVHGTRNVLELMGELDIPKGVYTSSLGIYGSPGTDPIDESYRYDGPLPTVYQRTKRRAHYEVAKPMMADGLPLVIVIPAGVFGPWDKPTGSVRSAVRDYLRGDLPVIPRGYNRPWEYAADTARSHILAIEHGTPGEEYIVAGESRTIVEVFTLAEEITGMPAPRTVSPTVLGVVARIMAGVERVVTPPEALQAERLRLLARTNAVVDNSKAKSELGIEHRPLEEGLREYLQWETDQLGMEMPVRSDERAPP